MIRVLFFIHDLSGGGAEKVLVNLVNNLDSDKFKVTVKTMFDHGVNKKYIKPEIDYKYVFKRLFRGNQHLLKLFSPKFLFNRMIKGDYDIIISYMQGATTRIIGGSKSQNKVLVNWIHNEMTKGKLANSYRNYSEFLSIYKRYDATIFVANSAKEVFESNTGLSGSNYVKYNTVETDKIVEKSREKFDEKFSSENINLITVGNLHYQKGYDRLLRIINRLYKEGFMIQLYILGKGTKEKELKDYVISNKLERYVTFLGYQTNPYKYVKNADLFVCSSHYEGYSTVVTESLIVGTPVITTLCSGMKEMLGENNEYGVIVENNEESLYKGLKALLSDKETLDNYREKAKERAEYFNKERTVREVEDLFTELYNRKNYSE